MLSILQRMYDINPNNPTPITDGITITCSDTSATLPIGGDYLRHAFIVLQDADITVKNAGGATLQRGTDYFILPSAMDLRYSKDYNTSIYSGIKFKATGTYTVTSFISCGTYPRAEWFNYLMEHLIYVRDVTVAALSEAVNSLTTKVNDMLSTVTGHSVTLADHGTRIFTAESDIDTLQDRCTTIEAVNTTQSSNISTLQTNLNSETTARTNGDSTNATNLTNHTSLTSTAHGATPAPTGSKIIVRDAAGRAKVAEPSENSDIATKNYVDNKIVNAGGGDVSSQESSSVVGYLIGFASTTGKIIKSLGVAIGNASGNVPLSNGTVNTNLNADMLDGYHAGHASGDVPVADGTKCINLWSDLSTTIAKAQYAGAVNIKTTLHLYLSGAPATGGFRYASFDYGAGQTGGPSYYGRLLCSCFVINGAAQYWTIYAHDDATAKSWRINCAAGTWDTDWTQLTDASGNAINANSLGGVAASSYALKTDTVAAATVAAIKTAVPFYGVFKYDVLYQAFISRFGTGAWIAGVDGGWSTSYGVYAQHASGASHVTLYMAACENRARLSLSFVSGSSATADVSFSI